MLQVCLSIELGGVFYIYSRTFKMSFRIIHTRTFTAQMNSLYNFGDMLGIDFPTLPPACSSDGSLFEKHIFFRKKQKKCRV